MNGHIDFQIIGVTRWRIATVAMSAPPLSVGRFRGSSVSQLAPFVEVSRANAVARRRPAVFEPMGRYGVLDAGRSAGGAMPAGHDMGEMR